MGRQEESDATVLIVDDERMNRALLMAALGVEPRWSLVQAADGYEAQKVLSSRAVDVVVTDLMMPGLDGLGLLRWARANVPGPAWIIHSALDTFDAAVEALKLGAFDFVPKPMRSVQLIQASVRNAVAQRQLVLERDRLQRDLEVANARMRNQVTELEAACGLLREQADTIDRDLKRAECIQRTLLPSHAPELKGFCVDAVYRPSRNVGGDLYGVSRLDDAHVALYIADAAGHGVAAAMLSVLVNRGLHLRDATGLPTAPSEVLADLDKAVRAHGASPGLFVTMAYAVLDTRTREVRFASAGHPPLVLRRAAGEVELLERTGPALGLSAHGAFGEGRVTLGANDKLLFYTDGLCDAPTGAAPLTSASWGVALGEAAGAATLRGLLDEAARRRGGAAGEDDLTMLLLTCADGVSTLDNGGSAEALSAPTPTAGAASGVRIAARDGTTFVAVAGRCTWCLAPSVFAACARAIDDEKTLIIDLSACSSLDSTCLGTLHEIVLSAIARGRKVRVQGVGVEVAHLFDELSMTELMSKITTAVAPLPEVMESLTHGGDGPERILRAHEALIGLSEHNRAEFADVVDALRAEVDATRADEGLR